MTHPNLTCTAFEAQLPDYLEGTLPDSAGADAELHLASCTSCRALVADLREITRQAATLPGIAPSRDLWPGIEARTHAKVLPLASRAPHHGWSYRRLGAVAAALVGITALGTWQLATGARDDVAAPTVATTPVPVPMTAAAAAPAITTPAPEPVAVTAVSRARRPRLDAGGTYAAEINRLRGVLDDRSGELDPATVAVLRSSVATIDSAISQARRALARDPASRFLTQQLNQSLERKLGLLRTAALLSPSA